jgi:hypothetical protein
MGVVHGHCVVLAVHPDLKARVDEVPSVIDALTAAIAAAIAMSSGDALAELKIVGRSERPSRGVPYRGRFS